MATKKPTAQAAAKQPVASNPAEKPEGSNTEDTSKRSTEVSGAATSQPGGGESEQSSAAGVGSTDPEQSKERGPAKDGNLSEDPDKESREGEVTLEVVTRLERRIRGGVIVTQEPRTVSVTEEVAELIEADPHISASRK